MSWGLLTSIDLRDCNHSLITNQLHIEKYAKELVDAIEMKAYGKPLVIHFGKSPEVAGFTLVQLIETSLISGHFVNSSDEAYIDIFSCKPYEGKKAADFTMEFFKAESMVFNVMTRGSKE